MPYITSVERIGFKIDISPLLSSLASFLSVLSPFLSPPSAAPKIQVSSVAASSRHYRLGTCDDRLR
jgi:hypothetical protein